MAGVAVYIGIDVVLQFLPQHYSVVSAAESNLAVIPFGWIMKLSFPGRAVTTFAVMAARSGTRDRECLLQRDGNPNSVR
ncbi:hypothetical protein [Arthrobacter glacialis]|uniref:hypothetical protein n=1 Tax=Arthrobacter glacialis TaxID=1664 RepID=UPI000CD3BE9E|nr:hypothetical protein [Arthrobacter glacialis]POH61150.1 hypothetical protein CVS28_01225 [Arthrobacter glacialis]